MTFSTHLRIATRKSPLALWQARYIGDALCLRWSNFTYELVPMVTSGDRFQKDKLLAIGGKGLFVKELEEALLDKRADIAVHSMKDVPARLPAGLHLPVICERHSPFDAFLSTNVKNLLDLPFGAKVGTASLRRQAQLLALRPDLNILSLRGNINTRINKLQSGELDAIILAHAGLERLQMLEFLQQVFAPEVMLPACGQGALGIECREQDEAVLTLISPLNDPTTTQCVQSERQVNASLGGNCHMPLAVYCKLLSDNTVQLSAKVATADGKIILSNRQNGPLDHALYLANKCAEELLNQGAQAILTQP